MLKTHPEIFARMYERLSSIENEKERCEKASWLSRIELIHKICDGDPKILIWVVSNH